jgi:hypothetical protein
MEMQMKAEVRESDFASQDSSSDGSKKKNKKLRGLSPRVNYIDGATAACQRS